MPIVEIARCHTTALARISLCIQSDELAGSRERQRVEQDAAYNGEKRHIRADAQRHHQNRNRGKSRCPRQCSGGVSEIAPEVVDDRDRVLLPQRLAHGAGIAEFDPRPPPCLFLRNAACHIFGDFPRHVAFHLCHQLRIRPPAAEKPVPAQSPPPFATNWSPITRPIARVICRQRLVSCTSCLRPMAVSR